MPNRMLRDWTDSEKINLLSANAERFFTRLIMKVDDYGCFYADTRLLKANLFPLLLNNIREADLLRWMAECQKAGLIVLYENANKKLLQIVDFRQRLDRAKSKFPLPHTIVNPSQESVNEPQAEQNRTELETEVEPECECGEPPTHTKEEVLWFENFENFIKTNAKNVAKMKEPFSIDQYLKLKINFSTQQIKDMVLKMHNYKPLLQKNNAAYLTFLNWSKKDFCEGKIETVSTGPSSSELKSKRILEEIR